MVALKAENNALIEEAKCYNEQRKLWFDYNRFLQHQNEGYEKDIAGLKEQIKLLKQLRPSGAQASQSMLELTGPAKNLPKQGSGSSETFV